MRHSGYIRFVIASSPDTAIRNAQGKYNSFEDYDVAKRYMREHDTLFPADAGFAIFEVHMEATELR